MSSVPGTFGRTHVGGPRTARVTKVERCKRVINPAQKIVSLCKHSRLQIRRDSKSQVFFRLGAGKDGANSTEYPPADSQDNIEVAALKDEAQDSAGNILQCLHVFAIDVEEGEKSVEEYVTLPAKRYSVLDSKAVQRVGENMFRVSTGRQSFMFGQSGEPVGVIEVLLGDNWVNQTLTSAEIVGAQGRIMTEMSDVLSAVRMSNRVEARTNAEDGSKQIVCTVTVEGNFQKGLMAAVPNKQLNYGVDMALRGILPWFLTKLKEDYSRWAAGDSNRGELAKGEMKTVIQGIMSNIRSGTLPEGVYELQPEANN